MIAAWLGLGGLAGSLALLAAAPAVAATPPERFFGVDPQTSLRDADYARIGEAGIGVVRFQLNWAAIDPGSAAGDYDWASADAVVGGAAAEGIRALPFAYGAPGWTITLDPGRCKGGCASNAPHGPLGRAAWRDFLGAAVDRYGPDGEFWSAHPDLPRLAIRDWQIWNEQNSPTYWRPRPNPRAYARLVRAAHRAIADHDPGARVILGGMFGTPFGGLGPGIAASTFLARLYRAPGARGDFEGVAVHPYGARLAAVKRQVERLRRRMARAGDQRAELWVTELGWASGGGAHPLNRGLRGQATRLRQSFRYLIRNRRELRLENVTWYSWRDTPAGAGLCAWCPESGLLSAGGEPKPAFAALTEFTGGT